MNCRASASFLLSTCSVVAVPLVGDVVVFISLAEVIERLAATYHLFRLRFARSLHLILTVTLVLPSPLAQVTCCLPLATFRKVLLE